MQDHKKKEGGKRNQAQKSRGGFPDVEKEEEEEERGEIWEMGLEGQFEPHQAHTLVFTS